MYKVFRNCLWVVKRFNDEYDAQMSKWNNFIYNITALNLKKFIAHLFKMDCSIYSIIVLSLKYYCTSIPNTLKDDVCKCRFNGLT